MFKNFCNAQGVGPRKFSLDMDVRWNATYLMLKHLLPYKDIFSVFINANFGTTLITPRHWHIAAKILEFLGDRRLQHSVDNQELAESFENLYLDVPEDGSRPPSASTSASASVASASSPAT
jgi:hypothetical protein